MKGYVQVYTGDGKGKTTAAIGLALRAAGAGLKVFIVQFIKSGDYSEIKTLQRLADMITVEQHGIGRFRKGPPPAEHVASARKGLDRARNAMQTGEYQMVILEEASVAIQRGLITVEDVLEVIDRKPEGVELVITGRRADERIIDRADLVTEMVPVKHYFKAGVKARVGIEK